MAYARISVGMDRIAARSRGAMTVTSKMVTDAARTVPWSTNIGRAFRRKATSLRVS